MSYIYQSWLIAGDFKLAKQIKLDELTNEILDEVSSSRKLTGALIKTKQDIVKQLILNMAKKELSKGKLEQLGIK